jgi:hypothetical protein
VLGFSGYPRRTIPVGVTRLAEAIATLRKHRTPRGRESNFVV